MIQSCSKFNALSMDELSVKLSKSSTLYFLNHIALTKSIICTTFPIINTAFNKAIYEDLYVGGVPV